MILTMGLSLGSPVEDVSETGYDESEDPPYEGAPRFSLMVPLVAARTTQVVLRSLQLKPGALSLFASARIHNSDANRSADARVSLALLCTLLC